MKVASDRADVNPRGVHAAIDEVCRNDLWQVLWYLALMSTRTSEDGALQKITVHVPHALLRRARDVSGSGITETVRQGLHLVAARDAYGKLRALRGRVRFDLDLKRLRED